MLTPWNRSHFKLLNPSHAEHSQLSGLCIPKMFSNTFIATEYIQVLSKVLRVTEVDIVLRKFVTLLSFGFHLFNSHTK